MGRLVASYWLWIALVVYWVIVIVAIVAEDREPATTLAWILVLGLLPGVGLVLYFLGGRDWRNITKKRQWAKALRGVQEPFIGEFHARYAQYAQSTLERYRDTPTGRLISAISGEKNNEPLPANEVDLWPCGGEYFPHLIDDITHAEKFVHMQYYVWGRDQLTAKICDALLDRLEHGVEVRILNDFVGSLRFKKDQLRTLRKAGAHVGSDVTQIGKLNYRNHRKITVVDGVIGHTGGMNLAQDYIDGGKKFPSWRDTSMRLTGPAVGELENLFAGRWYEVHKESLYDPRYFPPAETPVVQSPVMTHVVAQGIEDFWSSSTRAHYIAIAGAEKRVWLQSPYWVPDATLLDAFIDAALSGVDVKFMMTGLPDKKLAFRAAQSYWDPVLRSGGHIYLYTAGFLHAKTIVVDGAICAIGTMNLDIRSLQLNKELMVWLYDQTLARQQERFFENDLADCREITLEDIESWSDFRRFVNSASRLASSLL